MTDPERLASPDDTAASLAREIYWAKEGDPRPPTDLDSIRDRLDDFARRMRVEQRQRVPVGETLLRSAAEWKRKAKMVIWRVTRFSTMRYDRLLAELAELNGELAERLRETEEEVARLRHELGSRGDEAP
jgi:hypothetical protein